MGKAELTVAVLVAGAATLACFGLYVSLFDLSTGRLRTGVARGGAKAGAYVAGVLRRRGVLLLVLAAVAVVLVLLNAYFKGWAGPIRDLLGRVLAFRRSTP